MPGASRTGTLEIEGVGDREQRRERGPRREGNEKPLSKIRILGHHCVQSAERLWVGVSARPARNQTKFECRRLQIPNQTKPKKAKSAPSTPSNVTPAPPPGPPPRLPET